MLYDWEKLSRLYDAVIVLISADPDLVQPLEYWDCDTILVMNPRCIVREGDDTNPMQDRYKRPDPDLLEPNPELFWNPAHLARFHHIKKTCPLCNDTFSMLLNNDQAMRHRAYELGYTHIQDAFPELNPMEREFLHTGYCPECQKLIFRSNYMSSRMMKVS